MSPASVPTADGSRLNPFAFASDTDFHFVLLIVAVLSFSLSFYWIMSYTIGDSGVTLADIQQCEKAIEATQPPPVDIAAMARLAHQKSVCFSAMRRHQLQWVLGGVAVLFTLAGAVYWMLPRWRLHRGGFVPLAAEDAPEVATQLAELCREAGLSRPPVFVWNPLEPATRALAFGRFGKYYVGLSGGLVIQHQTDPAAFRAVLRHELAHLRNRDINKTYFTVAIWPAFLVAVLAPSLFTRLGIASLRPLVNEGLLILAALVYFTHNALLRTREYYADVRASGWDGPTGALRAALQRLPRPAQGRWRRPFQLHPDPQDRLHAVADPGILFRISYWESFAVGIAIALSVHRIDSWLLSNLDFSSTGFLRTLLASLIISPLAVGVVGLGVWRATFAAVIRGEAPYGAGRLGLAMGIGYLVGGGASTRAMLFGQVIPLIGFGAAWCVVLLAGAFLFFRWVQACAGAWIEIAATRRFMQRAYVAGLTLAGALFAVGLALLLFSANMKVKLGTIPAALGAPWLDNWRFISADPMTWLFFMSLWAFPLGAWFWRNRQISDSARDWAFLDPPSGSATIARPPPLDPWRALKAGLVGATLYCGLLLLIRIAVRLGVPESTRVTGGFLVAYFYSQCALAALVQAIVAATVAARFKRLPVIHGLFAAFVGGCVMTVGLLALNLAFGGHIDLSFTWNVFNNVVNQGAVLALLLMSVVVAVMGARSIVTRRFG